MPVQDSFAAAENAGQPGSTAAQPDSDADRRQQPAALVSPPSLSLPKGGGALRGVEEKFAANPATGTGTLSVPLPVSKGRSGFQPQLGLGYDSSAGNGPFGLGWQLDLSAVTRKTAKGMPAYRDAPAQQAAELPADPVVSESADPAFGLGAAEDTFLLSGAEDLVPSLVDSDGRWVPVVRHRAVGGREFVVREYRPRIEGLFARIERWTDVSTGATHWRSISKDNVTSVFGRNARSRIADPHDPGRVFSWLISESYDDIGNVIRYEYKSEDSVGVDLGASHERNRDPATRSVQRYLKRIRYGNRVSRLVDADLSDADWMFELVLDYGEHDPDAPTPREDRAWTARLDPFSTYRAGFEIRTYRLCRRVLMFHHFPDEPGVGADSLVRATELTYRGDPHRGEPVISFVESLRQLGFRRRPDGSHIVRSLPPVGLTYSRPTIDRTIRVLDQASLANVPAGVDGRSYRWIDLDGEGLSGVLSEQADAWFYQQNRGEGVLGPLHTVRRPAQAALMSGRQQLLDLSGTGHLDLVDLAGPTPGFTERTEDLDWGLFQAFRNRPDIDWDDPNLRMIDLNGDGLADVLITGEQAFTWHPSLGHEGYGPGSRTFVPDDEERGPRLIFADRTQSIHLADMSGDGLADLVRVRNGEINYWPNLGYGRFGAKVAMDGAPWLDDADQFDPVRIRLADVDGSGTSDLIYLHPSGAHLYPNRSGNGWDPAIQLGVAFPRIDDAVAVDVVDLLGSGTPCLVWSSPLPGDARRQVRFLDLMRAGKPHLLLSVRNNLGAETHVRYVPSTRFYLADQAAGAPWVTRLPFPVQVVEHVETVDRIGRNRLTTRYAYHHGYFDGVEREFRGFGMVEQFDTELFATLSASDALPDAANIDESSLVPPVVTRTWFHTGAFLDGRRVSHQFAHEYFSDDLRLPDSTLPGQLSSDEARQAVRALKGLMLRQEVYARDGSPDQNRPYLVTEHNYTVGLRQPAVQPDPDSEGMRHAVFLTTPRETLSAHYERQTDPRIEHALIFEVDDFGDVVRSASVAYGRRHPDPDPILTEVDRLRQQSHHIVVSHNDHTNAIEQPDDHRISTRSESQVFEVLGVAPAGRLFRFAELRAAIDAVRIELPYEDVDVRLPEPTRRLIEHTQVVFRRDDLSDQLPLGTLESRALPYETYRQVFTPGLLTQLYGGRIDATTLTGTGYVHRGEDWWIPSGRTLFAPGDVAELPFAIEHFFVPRRFRDPFGAIAEVDYDRYDLLVRSTKDPVGNLITAGDRDAEDRITSNGNDYRVLAPSLVSDPNRNRVAASFDALGRVAGTAVMGKPEEHLGDTLNGFDPDPDEALVTDYFRDPLADPHRLLRGATTRMVEDLFAFLRTREGERPQPVVVATLARETHVADLLPGQQTKVQHSFSYSDGFAREIQKKAQAEPGPLVEGGPRVDPRWVGTGWTIFNNKGSVVRKYEPFFSATHHFEFAAITGVSSVLFYDPVERVIATLHPNNTWEKVTFDPWRNARWDVNDTVLADPRQDPDIGGYVRPYLANLAGWRSWYDQRVDGELGPAEQAAARKTAVHAATPTREWLDSLDRTFLGVAHNRFLRDDVPTDEFHATRKVIDVEGNERDVIDALGRSLIQHDYNMLGSQLSQDSMDAGERLVLNDVAGSPALTWTSRGFRFRTEYDALRRMVRTFADGGDLPGEILLERKVYGEGQPDDVRLNLRAHAFRSYDGAGIATTDAYDFKGNELDSTRRLAVEYKEVIDWSTDVALEDRSYHASTRYDALNRPTELSTPDNTTVRPAYNEANLLERITANLRGADDATPFVADIDYNARGQRESIEYGNGARTRYSYDPVTFRLTRLQTIRDETALQDLGYTNDPIGNITHIENRAQQSIFFRNRRVDPDNDYTYDAVYRLIAATGREHLGQSGVPTPPSQDDAPRVGVPHPSDGRAMARYVQRYVYDFVGNILSMIHRGADPAGAGWTRRYRYDEPSLVQPEQVNNRLSGTATSDDAPLQRFGYDADGNITAMPELPVLRWDLKGQLQASARQVVSNGGVPETTYYVYDSGGQRVRKVTETQTGARRSDRLYLGTFEIFRAYQAGAVALERETLHILDGKQRIALVETRTTGEDQSPPRLTRYQLADHLGSSSLELDSAAAIISYEEYYPYGSTSYQGVRSQTETPKRYRYTGKERDEESGLSYHGARYCITWLGRWLNPDPARLAGGSNLYEYVGGNPIRMVDGTGLQPKDPPEQLWFSQSPPYRQPVTASRTGRGITDVDRANLRRAVQMWGGPTGEIEAGHFEKPFVLTRAGETVSVYAQGASDNASQGAAADRAAGNAARAAGQFARVNGVDVEATPGVRNPHPPLAPGFTSPYFQSWTPGPGPRGQLNLPFGEDANVVRLPPPPSTVELEAAGQLRLPLEQGLPAKPTPPVVSVAPARVPEQLELPLNRPPSTPATPAAPVVPPVAPALGLTRVGNVAADVTRNVVPGVAEAEVALAGGAVYAHAAGYTAVGTALETGAAAVPVVGAAAVVGAVGGNLAEAGAASLGASKNVQQASGLLGAALTGAGAGALVGSAGAGVGAVPGAIVGAAVGAGAYLLSKLW